MPSLFVSVGNRIQDFLNKSGMSQSELASKIGISKQVMSKIIHGKKAINVEEISRIAGVIGVSLEELLSYGSSLQSTDPVLVMMGTLGKGNTKDELSFLNHVMDEMIALEESLKG